MKPQNIAGLLNFSYEKSSAEIIEKVTKKLTSVRRKITEREDRVERVRSEYGITDAQIIDMLAKARSQAQSIANMSVSYSMQSDDNGVTREITIGAGVINALLTERDFIESERAQVEKLESIKRNLRDLDEHEGGVAFKRGHRLSQAELDYLGF